MRDRTIITTASISPLHCFQSIIINIFSYLDSLQQASSKWNSLNLDGIKEYASKLYFLFIKNKTWKNILAV